MKRSSPGFTIMELLVVMAIITIVTAVGVGMIRRRDQSLTVEANAKLVRSTLRLARNSAQSAGAGAMVLIDAEGGTMEASPADSGGNWHFEDETGSRGTKISVSGEFVGGGRLGRCLELKGGRADLGSHPFYQAVHGFRFALWVKPSGEPRGTLFLRENSFRVRVTNDAALVGEAFVGPQGQAVSVTTRAGVLAPGRWSHVSLAYDRLELTLEVNGVRYGRAKETRPLAVDTQARLYVGGPQDGFHGLVDEARYDVLLAGQEEQLSLGAEFMPQSDKVIRFDAQGHLDARFHQRPAVIYVKGDDPADEEGAVVETIRIELTGVIR